MPTGRHKSRTLRRVFVRTPGAKNTLTYRKRAPSKAKCADCGAVLAGVIRARPHVMKKTSKSSKKPTRPYGGNLCSKCSRKKIIEKARS